jgi:hypothetical protein
MPIRRIKRWTRFRLTESTSAIRRLPKYGRSKYNSSIRRINARFSAVSAAGA